MKTKVVYMIFGAIITSFGYLVGNFNNLDAEDEVARVKKLIVSEQITIESDNKLSQTIITPDTIIITKVWTIL